MCDAEAGLLTREWLVQFKIVNVSATCEDSTPETPNLEDYKSPPDREQEHHNEELEAHGKEANSN